MHPFSAAASPAPQDSTSDAGAAAGAGGAPVAVVGGGVAGLACAAELDRLGVPAVVYEATDRIGGRVRSWTAADGSTWELGAQVVHGTANPVWSHLPDDAAGESFRSAQFRAALAGTTVPLGTLARFGPPPWALPLALAASASSGSVGSWLEQRRLGRVATNAAREWFEQDWAGAVGELDAAELGAVVAARGAAVEERSVVGGLERLADSLGAAITVRRGTPVRRIEAGPDGVLITTPAGTTPVPAVVVTAPPWTVGTDLDLVGLDTHVAAAAALTGGDAVVAVTEIDRVAPDSVAVFDAYTGVGHLRCRSGASVVQVVAKGPAADRLRLALSDPDRWSATLARLLPWTGGAATRHIEVADWGATAYVRGAFTLPTAGAGAARAAWRAPAARCFFAGEATADAAGLGRVPGALESGRRAAHEVAAALSTSGPSYSLARSRKGTRHAFSLGL